MILHCAFAGLIGFVQVFLIALQTRQLAAGKTGWPIFLVSVGISGIWCAGVLSVVSRPIVAVFYVAAAACGAATAARLRLGGRRARSERLPRPARRDSRGRCATRRSRRP